MSDDLISRKALLNRFKYSETDNETDKAWICTVRRIIKEMPTAFDKEKVIKKLKHMEKDAFNYYNRYNDEMAFGESVAFGVAIEIVEKGGVE